MSDAKIKVLVTDDEADFRQVMVFWLNSKGYEVAQADSGETALKAIKDNPPDIVFLDLNMPGMDGVDVLKEIRQFNNDLPVIIISAYVESARLKEAEPYGVSGIFYKGGDFKDGLNLLETTLRTHKKLKK
ncbi:response regulator [bacterium]|nr:MAG: response regulator [bacterium]